MKIICIGKNYLEHIREMEGKIPEEPIFFLKPDTALLRTMTRFISLSGPAISTMKLSWCFAYANLGKILK